MKAGALDDLGEVESTVGDWHSYDEIAEAYDTVWSPRFAVVARHIWSLISPNPSDRILDIGTGTGIVLRMLSEVAEATGFTVGCDRSRGMLRRAQTQVTRVHVVAADATALPFRGESFGVVTASFVLSHVANYHSALAEILRVLRSGGTVAVSNWAPPTDPYSAAWSEWLAGAISKREVERAMAEVAPWEGHFSQNGALEAALTGAGFSRVHSDAIDVESDFSVEQFLEDRELSSAGRLAHHLLGTDGWARFRATAGDMFHTRFGSSFRYCRRALVVTARKLSPRGSRLTSA